jgi:hypothetical protein
MGDFEFLLPLATLSRNVLTLGRSISLAICNNTSCLGFGVDIASGGVSETPFRITLCFLIYTDSVELTMLISSSSQIISPTLALRDELNNQRISQAKNAI